VNYNPVNSYRETSVKTAGQGKLIVMLYEEAERQIEVAIDGLDNNNNIERSHKAIVKTQDIITELIVSLDLDSKSTITQNLFNLYLYFNQRLLDANIRKDVSILEEVRTLVCDLKGAWQQIEGTTAKVGQSMGGINIAG